MIIKKNNKGDLEAFERIYHDAKAFNNRAEQFLKEGQYSSVVFNVASIALEQYLIALCNLFGIYPRNHNYGFLMDSLEMVIEFPFELNNSIRAMDSIFDICSLENYHYGTTEHSDSYQVLSICSEVQRISDQIKLIGLIE